MIVLKELRMKKRWSASKLAREADLATATVLNIEKGLQVPTQFTVEALAEALGVDVLVLTEIRPSEGDGD